MYITIIIVCVVCAALFYGSYSMRNSFYLRSLCRVKVPGAYVALTFDDGVDPIMTPKVLDVLDRHGAKATFFIIGQKASQYPEIVKQIVARGHTIGNHSYNHQGSFPLKSRREIFREIEMCNQTLKSITGEDVVFFRPPYGVTNPMVGGAVRRSGLISVGWSVRSLDTMGGDRDKICNRVTRRMKAGSVILLHDRLDGADMLLDSILLYMTSRGIKSVTINELFDMKKI